MRKYKQGTHQAYWNMRIEEGTVGLAYSYKEMNFDTYMLSETHSSLPTMCPENWMAA